MIEHIQGFHIELTNICTLQCPGCARTKFIEQWPQHWKNHSIDVETLLNFLNIDLTDKIIHFCGNYGDPIYHKDLVEIVRCFKQKQARVIITTNGSYKTQEFWQDLCSNLTEHDLIIFSIDGTPKNFNTYRINGDWDSIELGLKAAVSSKVKVKWKYIPFSFNETDINSVRDYSQQLGVDFFELHRSDRFDADTMWLKPQGTTFVGQRFDLHQLPTDQVSVDPMCNDHRSHYISASGFYSPCCFVADHRFYYKTEFGRNQTCYDIRNQTLKEMLSRPAVVEFYKTIPTNPDSVCVYQCPKKLNH
jgi:organic radical activating enzyme